MYDINCLVEYINNDHDLVGFRKKPPTVYPKLCSTSKNLWKSATLATRTSVNRDTQSNDFHLSNII